VVVAPREQNQFAPAIKTCKVSLTAGSNRLFTRTIDRNAGATESGQAGRFSGRKFNRRGIRGKELKWAGPL
jgi:hypothetical protein